MLRVFITFLLLFGLGVTTTALHHAKAWMPSPPYRMWAFPYNLSATQPQGTGSNTMYPNSTYNLVAPPLGPYPCGTPQKRDWYRARGARCMSWSSCWNMPFANHLDNATVVASFKNMTLKNGETGADSALVLDECGEIYSSYPGHDAPDKTRTGSDVMTLAAEGFRQAKRERPGMFLAAWNVFPSPNTDKANAIFNSLALDGTFDLVMHECYTFAPPFCPIGVPPAPVLGPNPGCNISIMCYPFLDMARAQGFLNKTILTIGFMAGRSKLNPHAFTPQQLRAMLVQLKKDYPEMPGISFLGRTPGNQSDPRTFQPPGVGDLSDTATIELIRYASLLSLELWPPSRL